MTQEIDKDEHGDPIYKGGNNALFVTENHNDDIVASDLNADTLVAVDKSGRVRFRYNDKPPGGQQAFSPRQIVTDSMGRIIVADHHNDCLHILDQSGRFLKCIDFYSNDGPYGLSVDSEGRLWVGMRESGGIKVIQYLK
jgi:sugar lactone lactonase YvrE